MNSDYLVDASGYTGHADRVWTPADIAEVAGILRQANDAGIPVTIAGAGTGLTGGRVAEGGWVLSTEKLRRLEVHRGHAIAGAGVLLRELQAAAAPTGQFYAPDPTETTASVGGSIATNASGSRSFLYGATRDHVLSLSVVFMDGRVAKFRRGQSIDFEVPAIPLPRCRKNTAGYPLKPGMDWIDLLVGSEGTLAVVCEASLQLLPAVTELLTGVVFFAAPEQAVEAVESWRHVDRLRMLEYLDAGSLTLLRERFPEVPAGAGAALLVEQEASADTVADEWLERLEASGADVDAGWIASSDVDRERFRRFRHALPEAVNERVRRNGFQKLGSDYAVPVDRNRELMRYYRQRLDQEFPGGYVIFGHIGDAHVHVNLLPETQADYDRGRALMVELARKVVALEGTVSAEHGLGKRKAGLLRVQYSAEAIEAMQAVKRRLDPKRLLGRGNLFPAP